MEKVIVVGARASSLSQAQVAEVFAALRQHHHDIHFDPLWVHTAGDKDKVTSLRLMDKTDFFTKEIDLALLNSICRIAIHSAKDLPEPLPSGLSLVALTKGVDPSDMLVVKQGRTLSELGSYPIIATSSKRREEAVSLLLAHCPAIRFSDIRGTIEERLAILDSGAIDGVVLAEAALLRLNFIDRTRYRLPGLTAPLQGRLAVLARSDDFEMKALCSCIDEA